ncbi:MAG: hypothetical protein JXB07_11965 [Anaerolineae bacterium]|nr:hypothetical protein [Anaerolineae bacterium]
MSAEFFIYSFCATMFLALISLGFQIYMSRRLSKEGEKMPLPIGGGSWLTSFILGWQYARQLGLTEVMIAWTLVVGAGVIAGIVLIIGGVATYR